MIDGRTDKDELFRTIELMREQMIEQEKLMRGYRTALEKYSSAETDKYRIITPKQKVDAALKVLDTLYHYNGGYSASPAGQYQAFWLRDIMFCTVAKEYMGDFSSVRKSFGLVLDIFDKYSEKIDSAIDNRPTEKHNFLHARYRAHTVEEFPDEWGHNQLDIFGIFLYKAGDLKMKGIDVIRNLHDVKRLQDIIWYLYSIRWHEAPDYGVWEEGPELHSSSIGSVLGGLIKIRNHAKEVRVPARFIELGREALDRILPRESASRPYDMAQLSLIWPYRVLDEEMRAHVLRNIENNLVREHGVVRYPGDTYYNPDPMSPYGNEAEWPMGLSWLAIVYGKMAEEKFNEGGERTAIEYLKKSHHYVKRTEKTMTGEYVIPELYADGRPNPNTPLGWAQAMYIIAVQVIENLKARMERK